MEQVYAKAIGESGCYFLSIIKLAQIITLKPVDIVFEYKRALDAGDMQSDCFITAPEKILSRITGKTVTFKKVNDPKYLPLPGEHEILRFEWTTTMKTLGHFVLGDGKGGVFYDPYGKSQTVANGKLISKRIFKIA